MGIASSVVYQITSNYHRWVAQAKILEGIPRGKDSRVFYVDPANGSDTSLGTNPSVPLKSVAAAYALCTANRNDCVVMLGGPTADNPADTIAWAKDYTHLVGWCAPLGGVGQRCRIVCTTSPDETQVMTVSADGCIFRNIQFYNGTDADADSGAVVVSGDRNLFDNCFFAGMAHTTPAARAGSYSLKVSGTENLFVDCAIGLDTVLRAAANPELWLASGAARNTFKRCRFLSHSNTAGKCLVKVDDGIDRWIEFADCIFQNFSTNWGTALTNAFLVAAAATHYLVLRGQNQLVGVTGWADTVTHLYTADAAPNAGAGVSTQPTT